MVRITDQNDQRLRPLLYVSLWQSIDAETWRSTKSFHSIPPTNRRLIRAQEPMGRTISTIGDIYATRRLDRMAFNSYGSTQQLEKCDNWSFTKPGVIGI